MIRRSKPVVVAITLLAGALVALAPSLSVAAATPGDAAFGGQWSQGSMPLVGGSTSFSMSATGLPSGGVRCAAVTNPPSAECKVYMNGNINNIVCGTFTGAGVFVDPS